MTKTFVTRTSRMRRHRGPDRQQQRERAWGMSSQQLLSASFPPFPLLLYNVYVNSFALVCNSNANCSSHLAVKVALMASRITAHCVIIPTL